MAYRYGKATERRNVLNALDLHIGLVTGFLAALSIALVIFSSNDMTSTNDWEPCPDEN